MIRNNVVVTVVMIARFASTTALALVVTIQSSMAAWTVQTLHPVGLSDSFGYADGGGEQAGQVRIGSSAHAGVWTSLPSSFVDIHPSIASDSAVLGAYGSQQVGFAVIGGHDTASLWHGTASSWLSLSPLGSSQSRANTTDGNCQGGYAVMHGVPHAGFWRGTSSSFVDLHPPSASASVVTCIDSNQQIGYVVLDAKSRASVWDGSKNSWHDLHAIGDYSYAYGGGGGKQVGWTNLAGVDQACLWSSSASTFGSLHPFGKFSSRAFATNGWIQVGTVSPTSGTLTQAAVWYGSAESVEILPIPAGFTSTFARSIGEGDRITIVGSGYNAVVGRNEALLWLLTPTISGRFELPDFLGSATTLRAGFSVIVNGTVVESTLQNLSSDAEFSFLTQHMGNADLQITLPYHLTFRLNNVYIGVEGLTNLVLSLINGDVNEDNEINLLDFAVASFAFGAVEGDSNWIEGADLNGDLEVNLADVAIISHNFGQVGD